MKTMVGGRGRKRQMAMAQVQELELARLTGFTLARQRMILAVTNVRTATRDKRQGETPTLLGCYDVSRSPLGA